MAKLTAMARHALEAVLCLAAFCSKPDRPAASANISIKLVQCIFQGVDTTSDDLTGTMAQTTCSFRDYNIPLPVDGCGQTGLQLLAGCEYEWICGADQSASCILHVCV